jgi:hypothetical protein
MKNCENMSDRAPREPFTKHVIEHKMTAMLGLLLLSLVAIISSRDIPVLNQRFSGSFKISHPFTGTLGQGQIFMDWAKHSMRGLLCTYVSSVLTV